VTQAPRRVCLLHSSAGHYGADRQLALLATGLDPERWKPLVVCALEGPLTTELRERGVEVYTGPLAVLRRELLSPRGLSELGGLLHNQGPSLEKLLRLHDVAIVHANTSVILGARGPAHTAGAKYVAHVREIYPEVPGVFAAQRRQLLRADAVVCVSEATRRPLAGPADEHVRVIHDGLAVELERAERVAARLALGVPREPFVVALLGRISSWKGQEVLVRALAEEVLAQTGAVGVIAGDAWPGQEHHEQRLRELVAGLGLGERVRFVGFRGDVGNVYGAADVVVVPSTKPDPLPNSAIEAAAAGCCVVAANHGGLPEIVKDNVTGRLVAPGDHRALATALADLATHPRKVDRLGLAAKIDARRRFGADRFLGQVSALYDELLRR
jgi:glycosyltransferase involved in cell wall biosynthesis